MAVNIIVINVFNEVINLILIKYSVQWMVELPLQQLLEYVTN